MTHGSVEIIWLELTRDTRITTGVRCPAGKPLAGLHPHRRERGVRGTAARSCARRHGPACVLGTAPPLEAGQALRRAGPRGRHGSGAEPGGCKGSVGRTGASWARPPSLPLAARGSHPLPGSSRPAARGRTWQATPAPLGGAHAHQSGRALLGSGLSRKYILARDPPLLTPSSSGQGARLLPARVL